MKMILELKLKAKMFHDSMTFYYIKVVALIITVILLTLLVFLKDIAVSLDYSINYIVIYICILVTIIAQLMFDIRKLIKLKKLLEECGI